jgi:hypothetical protein
MSLKWLYLILVHFALVFLSCGQQEVLLPENPDCSAGTSCGSWYPTSGSDGGAAGFDEGETFPCLVWESARQNGGDTFLNVGEEYLKAKHSKSTIRAMVLILSAGGCPSCTSLIYAMQKRIADFEAKGALVVGIIWRDLSGADLDYDLDKAEETLVEQEFWPAANWPLTNDEEEHLRDPFQEGFPRILVIQMADMQVRSASTTAFSPDDQGVSDLLQFLSDFP